MTPEELWNQFTQNFQAQYGSSFTESIQTGERGKSANERIRADVEKRLINVALQRIAAAQRAGESDERILDSLAKNVAGNVEKKGGMSRWAW